MMKTTDVAVWTPASGFGYYAVLIFIGGPVAAAGFMFVLNVVFGLGLAMGVIGG